MYTYDRYTPLNSNLILLIPPLHLSLIVPYLSLNSNLILLIQGAGRPGRSLVWSFKFQSDSINTIFDGIYNVSKNVFKFQSDSINTITDARRLCEVINFKFQSDSINTMINAKLDQMSQDFKFQSDSINTDKR